MKATFLPFTRGTITKVIESKPKGRAVVVGSSSADVQPMANGLRDLWPKAIVLNWTGYTTDNPFMGLMGPVILAVVCNHLDDATEAVQHADFAFECRSQWGGRRVATTIKDPSGTVPIEFEYLVPGNTSDEDDEVTKP